MDIIYKPKSYVYIHMRYIYVYVYICMICAIWMLIHVSYVCLDFIASVGSSFHLGGVGSVLIKVRGNMGVVC